MMLISPWSHYTIFYDFYKSLKSLYIFLRFLQVLEATIQIWMPFHYTRIRRSTYTLNTSIWIPKYIVEPSYPKTSKNNVLIKQMTIKKYYAYKFEPQFEIDKFLGICLDMK